MQSDREMPDEVKAILAGPPKPTHGPCEQCGNEVVKRWQVFVGRTRHIFCDVSCSIAWNEAQQTAEPAQ
jgi:hypothetical protein